MPVNKNKCTHIILNNSIYDLWETLYKAASHHEEFYEVDIRDSDFFDSDCAIEHIFQLQLKEDMNNDKWKKNSF
jgi:hypothetical protein